MILCSTLLIGGILYYANMIQAGRLDTSDSKRCMGIPIISEEQFQSIALNKENLDNMVRFEGALAAYDQESRQLYIPCVTDFDVEIHQLKGKLQSAYQNYSLYFLDEVAFENIAKAIEEGHQFTLMAVDFAGNYMIYHVVFTTLPVVEICGQFKDMDEREREVYSGEIKVWGFDDFDEKNISFQRNRLEWNIRGNSALYFPKKSYRVSLKDSNGAPENASFLGLENDDDYILNPMWMDDLKVREKLVTTMWNQIADQNQSSLRMADAEYCELIINGKYKGVYLLQERIAKKTLKLNEQDILFKGSGADATESSKPQDIFELVYSTENEGNSFAMMEDYLYKTDFSGVDKNNWIDNQLFMYLGHMIDNRRYKNMYYVINRFEEKSTLYLVPWDTDMSFGVAWDDGFVYKTDSVEKISNRVEYDAITKQYPEIEQMLSKRWCELRKSVFSEENIFNIVDSNYEILDSSGVLTRDYHVYHEFAWDGEDTRENLEKYITRRLELLDKKYGYIVGEY